MNPEYYMVALPAISWALFALGGTTWKGWRRFILPAVFMGSVLLAGFVWWKALLVALIAVGAFTQGYGISSTWPKKLVAMMTYGIISVPLGISWWNLLTVVLFPLLFILSNAKVTANTFVWKLVEGIVGCLCGIQLSYLISGSGGIVW